jgi:glutamine synthetase
VPLDQGSYFDLTTADVSGNMRKKTIQTLEAMGIPVEYSFHEDSAEPARDRPAPHRRSPWPTAS